MTMQQPARCQSVPHLLRAAACRRLRGAAATAGRRCRAGRGAQQQGAGHRQHHGGGRWGLGAPGEGHFGARPTENAAVRCPQPRTGIDRRCAAAGRRGRPAGAAGARAALSGRSEHGGRRCWTTLRPLRSVDRPQWTAMLEATPKPAALLRPMFGCLPVALLWAGAACIHRLSPVARPRRRPSIAPIQSQPQLATAREMAPA